jgi:hypothetical protein
MGFFHWSRRTGHVNNFLRHRRLIPLLAAIAVMISSPALRSQGFEFKGQASAWGSASHAHDEWNETLGLRYIPQFNYSYSPDESDLLNTEVLFNTFYSTDLSSNDGAFKLYRAIFRYTTTQTETQLGLQKINFGPAQLLRPLMWFDKVDPRDPLKLTDGVYGLRYKYSFMNNSIAWAWGLYGNSGTKGYEAYRTAHNAPEFGGRVQVPVPAGEVAATVHTRKADAGQFEYRENRYAVDGRWDVGVGLWFESVWQQNNSPMTPYGWNRMTTLGSDYTIPAGNGIYVLGEHMVSAAASGMWNTDRQSQISALMLTYPLGVLDNVAVQEYYAWQNRSFYQYYQWQRTYDNFILTLSVFHYPENGAALFSSSAGAPASGLGAQLMLIYNY